MTRMTTSGSMQAFMVRALSFTAIAAMTLSPTLTPLLAADARSNVRAPVYGEGQMGARFLELGLGKSIVVDLPRDVKDVLVANPKVANAVVRSAQRAYIIGATIGQTNIVFFDAAGQQISAYDISVTADINSVRAALKQTMPGSVVRVDSLGKGVVLTGSVANALEAQQAVDIAARLVEGVDNVVNNLTVRGRDQVMLKVVVAEVQRNIVKQLGVDLSASMGFGTSTVTFNNNNAFTARGSALADNKAVIPFGGNPNVTATIRAMENAGLVRTLAEPSLTAISGETANFLAGGEFPVPGGNTCDPTTRICTTQITFKKFGISLGFTPIVLSEGRISLRVATEVSELSQENSVTLSGVSIPAIKTNRADTTLEIPSGGSMVMAGLIREQTKQGISGLPGMAQLPVLGTLFRSRDYVNNNTELMILVTPYVVRAVASKDLSRPDDGFADSSDPQADLLGTVNRIYGAPGRPETTKTYRGTYGFITD